MNLSGTVKNYACKNDFILCKDTTVQLLASSFQFEAFFEMNFQVLFGSSIYSTTLQLCQVLKNINTCDCADTATTELAVAKQALIEGGLS